MSLDVLFVFFFCKQKTAYVMRISDWSSDVCSSDLVEQAKIIFPPLADDHLRFAFLRVGKEPDALAVELTLQRLGVGRNPHRTVGLRRPERSRSEITDRKSVGKGKRV